MHSRPEAPWELSLFNELQDSFECNSAQHAVIFLPFTLITFHRQYPQDSSHGYHPKLHNWDITQAKDCPIVSAEVVVHTYIHGLTVL